MTVTHKVIGISFPTDLLAKIDRDRDLVTRSKFIQRMVEQAFAMRDKEKKK